MKNRGGGYGRNADKAAMYSVRRAVIEECVRSGKPSSMTTAAMTADDQYDDDDDDDDNDNDNDDDG
jgi:hypothetical protein